MITEYKKTNKNTDRIHFLNTGSSDAILIESDGKFALVDCAEDTDNPRGFKELELDGYEDLVLQYLKDNAADRDGNVCLDFVLGTHSHSDHIGGFDTIVSNPVVHIKKAYLKEYDEKKVVKYEVEKWDNKEVYEQMVNVLNEKNIPIISKPDGRPFLLGNFKITLFNTEDNDKRKVGENDHSLGLLVEKNGTKVFLAGDIDNFCGDERRLAPKIGKVDLLKVGHHSYAGSTSIGWLMRLRPTVCVITNNENSTNKRTLSKIRFISHSDIFITGKENGIIAEIGDGGKIEYFNNIHK